MIDFDKLVLGPAMKTFAEPFIVIPSSDSNVSQYGMRGVWTERPNDIIVGDELISSGQIRTVGFRASEVSTQPQPGWRIKRSKNNATYYIDDYDDDGQGGTLLTLKEAE